MSEETEKGNPLIGQLVSDRYRIVRQIGEGGMGTVFEAVHEAIEKKIALKVLHSQYSASPDVVRRFKQEAISASRIKHQNVIDVFDFGQLNDGSCFIAMEFLEGKDLGQTLEQQGRLVPARAIQVTYQICRALGLGHGRGVVHRDLKPENVFLQKTLEEEEVVKIVDFGIAQLRDDNDAVEDIEKAVTRPRRLTKTGMIFGTPEYMAPEQARGQNVDQRSDIYATGVILYELLTGAVPFLGESFLEVLNQHIQSIVPPVDQVNPEVKISPELARAVHKALEKDPDDRFPTMKDFAAALQRTPEGRSAGNYISSPRMTEEDTTDPESIKARVENTAPPHSSGAGTAMFGSPGSLPEEEVSIPHHSSKGMIMGVVGALVLIVGAGAYALTSQKKSEGSVESPASVVSPPTDVSDVDPETRGETPPGSESETDVESEPATPEENPGAGEVGDKVSLHVTTLPPGAVVKKDGFQVCDAAPCDVVVDKGEAVTLTAQKGSAKGEAKVLAQKEQNVSIRLSKPRAAPRPRPEPSHQPAALCEVMVDGIKILRPCK